MTSNTKRWLVPLVFLMSLWWLLTSGDTSAIWFGTLVVLAAVWVAHRLGSVNQTEVLTIRLAGLPSFVCFFLHQSWLAGVETAQLASSRSEQLAPGLIVYRHGLTRSAARRCFILAINLLPGTLCVDEREEDLLIHVLDSRKDNDLDLLELEQRVAGIFALDPPKLVGSTE